MGRAVALHALLSSRQIWRGKLSAVESSTVSTGLKSLDESLPLHGWPEASLIEILLPADGVGEIDLLASTFRRFTQEQKTVALIAPPYVPYPPAWLARGIDLHYLHIIEADQKHALWAFEQCLRSGSCAAVIGWPNKIDHHGLRRLHIAADAGRALGFALRDAKHAGNASPAPLRLEIDCARSVTIRKCRGSVPSMRSHAIALNS